MKNKITLLRSYTSMLWGDIVYLAFNPLLPRKHKKDWSKLRSVSRQIFNNLKTVYK